LAIILLFIPLSLSFVLTIGTGTHPFDISHACLNFNIDQSRKRSIMIRVALSLVPVILYLFLLSWIPLPDALAASDMTTTALSRLVVLGTIILGLLSGFGAVSNVWAFFSEFRST
jgi:The Golgi pH Regulator (GPHR) Family N-terminal